MTCKDCIHFGVCIRTAALADEPIDKYCTFENEKDFCVKFSNKTQYIKLPCKVGDTVYYIAYICDIKKCSSSDRMSCCGCSDYSLGKYRIKEKDFDLEDLNKVGVFVYLTKEEAEKSLQNISKIQK